MSALPDEYSIRFEDAHGLRKGKLSAQLIAAPSPHDSPQIRIQISEGFEETSQLNEEPLKADVNVIKKAIESVLVRAGIKNPHVQPSITTYNQPMPYIQGSIIVSNLEFSTPLPEDDAIISTVAIYERIKDTLKELLGTATTKKNSLASVLEGITKRDLPLSENEWKDRQPSFKARGNTKWTKLRQDIVEVFQDANGQTLLQNLDSKGHEFTAQQLKINKQIRDLADGIVSSVKHRLEELKKNSSEVLTKDTLRGLIYTNELRQYLESMPPDKAGAALERLVDNAYTAVADSQRGQQKKRG